jgi:EAL domain-containing protein (putative c-di-GMP-specific phosphodiesterase class I)
LNIITVVEGLETRAQLEIAQLEECDEGQGFLFSPPVAGSEVAMLLQRREVIAVAA